MADKTLQEIVSNVQTQARFFRAVLDLADRIDDVAKLEQLRGEADASLTAKRQEVDAAQADLSRIMGQIKAGNVAAAKAAERVKALESAAADAGKAVLDEANAQAAGIVQAARDAAAAIASKSKAAEADLQALLGQVDEAGKTLAATQSQHDDLLAKIADAKDRIAKMMGA